MADGTQIHNDICRAFKSKEDSQLFLQLFSQEGCKKINKIIMEDIISNNNILIGYCDVVIDYEDNDGRQQKALIEVKSSVEVINKDPQGVLRQIKKYRFYNKKVTKSFLVYSNAETFESVEDTDFFTDEDITVVEMQGLDLDWLKRERQQIQEKKEAEIQKKKEAEIQKKEVEIQKKKEAEKKEAERIKAILKEKEKVTKVEKERQKRLLQKSIINTNSPGYRNKWFGN